MIDDVVEGVFESAGEDLTREGNGEQFELVVVVVFVSGHPVLRISAKGCWIIYSSENTLLLGVEWVFLQAQRKSEGLRAFAQSLSTDGLGLTGDNLVTIRLLLRPLECPDIGQTHVRDS